MKKENIIKKIEGSNLSEEEKKEIIHIIELYNQNKIQIALVDNSHRFANSFCEIFFFFLIIFTAFPISITNGYYVISNQSKMSFPMLMSFIKRNKAS